MSTKAWRIQQAEHPIEWLLDPEHQFSTSWTDCESVRNGVSACRSVEELAEYLAQVGIAFDGSCSLVEMVCDWADDEDEDDELGAVLVIPTEIVSAKPLDDEFFTLINAAYDRIYA